MKSAEISKKIGVVSLILAVSLITSAFGFLARDLGASTRFQSSGGIVPGRGEIIRFYAYELTYEVAIFSTVEVSTVVESSFDSWHREYQSNGSFTASFRPDLPGMYQLTVRNLEEVSGQLSVTLLQSNPIPPELETSVLNPILFATVVLLWATTIALAYARKRRTAIRISQAEE